MARLPYGHPKEYPFELPLLCNNRTRLLQGKCRAGLNAAVWLENVSQEKCPIPASRTMIDTSFNMYSDANGGDPDATSPTLRSYHKLLWNKSLPNGDLFGLLDNKPGFYLFHSSELGDFSLGSDAITHSYKNHTNKKWLTTQIPNEVQDLFDHGSTIGAYLIFPNNQVDRKHTLNQARGISRLIDDRFDLTLECIKRFYINEPSPLEEALRRHASFFRLFETFEGYVQFFLLNDLVDEQGAVKFYLPFDDFQSPPKFRDIDDYLIYKSRVESFVESRGRRMEEYTTCLKTYQDGGGQPAIRPESK